MAVPVEARDIVVRDYSPEYGTVKQVIKQGEDRVQITFENGTVLTPDNDMEFIIEQGGRF